MPQWCSPSMMSPLRRLLDVYFHSLFILGFCLLSTRRVLIATACKRKQKCYLLKIEIWQNLNEDRIKKWSGECCSVNANYAVSKIPVLALFISWPRLMYVLILQILIVYSTWGSDSGDWSATWRMQLSSQILCLIALWWLNPVIPFRITFLQGILFVSNHCLSVNQSF